MKYELIATLGPSSSSEALWQAMLSTGVTALRLNTSHLSLEQLEAWLEKLERFTSHLDMHLPLVLDLQGSKWRLGQLAARQLADGEIIDLVYSTETALDGALPVPHADFFQAAERSNGEIVLNDARVRLMVEKSTSDRIRARVTLGGPIASHKGITFGASEFRKEALNEKDQAILRQTRGKASIRYAISYVKDAVEMSRYRALCGKGAYLAAKLERQPALEQARQIAETADELWLCRGDLGAELGQVGMAEAVFRFSAQLSAIAIPVYLAGQVLEHMVEHPTPTRSEVCYLYEALQKGYAGAVLSDETAVGRYPVESCQAAAQFRLYHK
jgi:pyruvate kinase